MLRQHPGVPQLFAVGLALLATGVALASVSPVIFRIEATNGINSDFYEVTSDQLVPDPVTGGQKWVLAGPYELGPVSDLIATLNSATLTLVDDPLNTPRLLMNFEVLCGETDATFLVESALVSFPTLPANESRARATAGFTLTDYNDGIPAALEGMDPANGLGIFTAQYNGFVPDGVEFANLVAGLYTDSGGTVTANQKKPPTGFEYLGVGVYDISTMNAFTLTANDLMSGQTSFFVMPEPLSALLLAALGLCARRR